MKCRAVIILAAAALSLGPTAAFAAASPGAQMPGATQPTKVPDVVQGWLCRILKLC